MKKIVLGLLAGTMLLGSNHVLAAPGSSARERSGASPQEDYVRVPMPPGFQVVVTELEGPVFADANGKTLYKWPYQMLRGGYVGDEKGKSACTNVVTKTSEGLFSPYPPGLILPDLENRPSCVDMWPPVLADENAKPVGDWTIITRPDGKKQWAYDGQAVYTSVLDRERGDVLGGTNREKLTQMAGRYPVQPPPNVPPGFRIVTTFNGRLLVNSDGFSVYASKNDGPDKSNCDAKCQQLWKPIPAPAVAQPFGEWSIVERAPGVRQWAFRKQPLYTYARDINLYSQEGSDVPGWYNVYTQRTKPIPSAFQLVDTQKGVVVADSRGKAVYAYICSDDSFDQLSCDYPGAPPVWRITVCGGGDVDRCLKTWPYVVADANARSESSLWSVIEIEPRSGRLAKPGEPGALRVWAYRGSPVYTYEGDEPGLVRGDMFGEYYAERNGFKALWVRDDFFKSET
jgi:predicted lipoprotein with Yx(FWY)xxD motif